MTSDRTVSNSLAIAAVIILGVCVLTATGLARGHADKGPGARHGLILAEDSELLPADTLSDWATYGDAIVRATLTDATDLPDSEYDLEHAYIPRGLVLNVDDVLWTREGIDRQAVPDVLHFQLDGWDDSTQDRRAVRDPDLPQMAVGDDYLILLTHLIVDTRVLVEQWAPTAHDAIIPVSGEGDLNTQDRAPSSDSQYPPDDVRQSMTGKSIAQLVDAVRTTPPDPAAVPFMSLPPDQRFERATDR
jgi:hypothetical protein